MTCLFLSQFIPFKKSLVKVHHMFRVPPHLLQVASKNHLQKRHSSFKQFTLIETRSKGILHGSACCFTLPTSGAQLSRERLVSEIFTIYIQTKKYHHLNFCLKKHWIPEGWMFFKKIHFPEWNFQIRFCEKKMRGKHISKKKRTGKEVPFFFHTHVGVPLRHFFSQKTTREGESLDVDWLLYRATW